MKKLYITLSLSLIFMWAPLAAAPISLFSSDIRIQQTEDQIKVFYAKNYLHINGLNDYATIEIYNMLGRKIASYQNIQITDNYSKSVSLPTNNIFIVSVQTENFKKTFKIVTK